MTSEQVAERSTLGAGRIAAGIARQVEVGLAGTELSLSQYRVLCLLAEGMALPSSMAVRLDVRRPSITAVVDGLVSKGLVVRAHGEDDRRQVTHEITEEGLRTLMAADEAVDARLSSILAHLDEGEEVEQAMRDLMLWGKALANWRRAKARPDLAPVTAQPEPCRDEPGTVSFRAQSGQR